MKRIIIAAVASVLVATSGVSAPYVIRELAGLAPEMETCAYGINNSGQVAGWSYSPEGRITPVVWSSSGQVRRLGLLAGMREGQARGINDSGVTVGWQRVSFYNDSRVAIVWDAEGNPTSIGALPGDFDSVALGVNKYGQVVGFSQGSGRYPRAFIWDVANGIREIPMLSGAAGGIATDINDSGQISGSSTMTRLLPGYLDEWTRAFRASLDVATVDLGVLNYKISGANAINNNGQVAGFSTYAADDAHTRAALWNGPGSIQNLDPTLYTYFYSEAFGINNLGQVVGVSPSRSTQTDHATLWDIDGSMVDLGVLSTAWWSKAYNINDSGWIVGESTYRATLWTPVPEPSSILALICGLGAIGGTIWRRRR